MLRAHVVVPNIFCCWSIHPNATKVHMYQDAYFTQRKPIRIGQFNLQEEARR